MLINMLTTLSSQAIQIHTHTILQECQVKLSHTLPLTSYLIKPVQRILKFPLLLEDLCKKFEWTEHPGHKRLKQALVKMSSVATEINTAFNDPVSFVHLYTCVELTLFCHPGQVFKKLS